MPARVLPPLMIHARHAVAACRAAWATAQRELGRTGGAAIGQARPVLAGLAQAAWRTLPAARSVDSSRGGAALARHLARQGSPSFMAAIAGSVLLHAGLLAALLILQRSAPLPFVDRAIAVTLTAEDPAARVGAEAGIAWNSAASRAAITALLTARRDASLMDELVVTLVRRPHPANRPRPTPPPPPRAAVVVAAADAAPARAVPASLPVVSPTYPSAAIPAIPPLAAAPTAAPTDQPTAVPLPGFEAALPAPVARAPTPPQAPSRPAPAPTAAPVQAAAATPPPIERTAGGDADRRYLDAVLERLQRLKDYPGLARYHTSGKVEVAFRVARDGTVLTAEVHRSSGYSFLDKAGVDIIYRASPLPALPASLPGDSWPIVVPISFRYD